MILSLTGVLIITFFGMVLARWQAIAAELKAAALERRLVKKEAEVANLEYENEQLFEANQGLTDRLRAFMLPLPGEERVQEGRVLN